MDSENRSIVVTNYYRAINSLLEIGAIPNISDELRQLVVNAGSETMKIIDYVNEEVKREGK